MSKYKPRYAVESSSGVICASPRQDEKTSQHDLFNAYSEEEERGDDARFSGPSETSKRQSRRYKLLCVGGRPVDASRTSSKRETNFAHASRYKLLCAVLCVDGTSRPSYLLCEEITH